MEDFALFDRFELFDPPVDDASSYKVQLVPPLLLFPFLQFPLLECELEVRNPRRTTTCCCPDALDAQFFVQSIERVDGLFIGFLILLPFLSGGQSLRKNWFGHLCEDVARERESGRGGKSAC